MWCENHAACQTCDQSFDSCSMIQRIKSFRLTSPLILNDVRTVAIQLRTTRKNNVIDPLFFSIRIDVYCWYTGWVKILKELIEIQRDLLLALLHSPSRKFLSAKLVLSPHHLPLPYVLESIPKKQCAEK